MCVCIYAYIYVYMYIYIFMYAWLYTYINVCMYIYIYIDVNNMPHNTRTYLKMYCLSYPMVLGVKYFSTFNEMRR
jgi:hypothetical protein